MKSLLLAFSISLIALSTSLAFNFQDLKAFKEKVEELQREAKQIQKELNKPKPVPGVIEISDTSKPWYIKFDWFDAGACSLVYYQINSEKPVLIAQFVGTPQIDWIPIEVKGLKPKDKLRIVVETYWGGHHYGPVDSSNPEYFKVFKIGRNKFRFTFEDAAAADKAYNDGSLTLFQADRIYAPARIISLTHRGNLVVGKVKVNSPGQVKAFLEFSGRSYDLSFTPKEPGTYTLKAQVPPGTLAAILRIDLNGVKDSREVVLKGCGSETLSDESLNSFGTANQTPFSFKGKVYLIPEGTNKLPDFSKLTPVGIVYAKTLNVPPRNFSEGFPGVTNRYEWFAIDYTGEFFLTSPRKMKFALLSDDGAKLIIDGKTVIDNDGIHPPTEKYGEIELNSGLHKIEVQYFQGPKYQVALVLSLIKEGEKVPFNIGELYPVKVDRTPCGLNFTLNSLVLFDFNSYKLKPEAKEILNQVLFFLKKADYKKIVVKGYTDNIGSREYNLQLSIKRARAVANYLISKGVEADKVEAIGFGESNPRYPNTSQEGRAKNRRVEIELIGSCGVDLPKEL
jgi:outer membrane protein OmpA-like peptidoglycan-associated protein